MCVWCVCECGWVCVRVVSMDVRVQVGECMWVYVGASSTRGGVLRDGAVRCWGEGKARLVEDRRRGKDGCGDSVWGYVCGQGGKETYLVQAMVKVLCMCTHTHSLSPPAKHSSLLPYAHITHQPRSTIWHGVWNFWNTWTASTCKTT